jgi:SAM-dependent methyltransferase
MPAPHDETPGSRPDGAMRCGACGEPGCAALPEHPGWEWFGRRWTLVRCGACGSSRTDPLPDAAVLEQVYGAGFDYRWYRHHYPAKLADAFLRLLELRRAGLALGPRVLDYGGGIGYLSRAARLLGLEAQTWDPFLVRGAPPPRGPFDAVLAVHVVEHGPDLDGTFARLGALLRPEGLLVLAVPNAGGEGYRAHGERWVWAQPPLIHVHHLTELGLRSVLARHGFEVVRVDYRERWDANRLSDLRLKRHFARLDDGYGASRPWLKAAIAARNTLLRYVALAASGLRPAPAGDQAELGIVARLEGPR